MKPRHYYTVRDAEPGAPVRLIDHVKLSATGIERRQFVARVKRSNPLQAQAVAVMLRDTLNSATGGNPPDDAESGAVRLTLRSLT